jgi:hypothetical protein
MNAPQLAINRTTRYIRNQLSKAENKTGLGATAISAAAEEFHPLFHALRTACAQFRVSNAEIDSEQDGP